MKAVFQIVFEMMSFFIIFADHVIILTLFTTLSTCVDFMAPMIVGSVLTPPRCQKVEFVAQDTWDNLDQLQKYMF